MLLLDHIRVTELPVARSSPFPNQSLIIQEGSNGTVYDVEETFGKGFQHNNPAGELSLGNYGFTIGDNSSDAHPNKDGTTYTFVAR